MNHLDENSFIDAIRQRLDASLVNVDANIATRLDKIRRQALATPRLSSSEDNQALLDSARNTLDDNEALPAAIEARLDNIRQQAMARMQLPDAAAKNSLLSRIQQLFQSVFETNRAMTSMAATACVMVTVVSIFYVSSRPTGILSLEEEIGLIASADDIELYENLDFYLWLEENGMPN